MTLSYGEARSILESALAKAQDLGIPSSVAVVDRSGELVAFGAQDFAPLVTREIAIQKAYTSAVFGASTSGLEEATQPGGPLWGLQASTSRPLVTIGGGVPLSNAEGQVVGAVGASGGTPQQDEVVASTAADHWRASSVTGDESSSNG